MRKRKKVLTFFTMLMFCLSMMVVPVYASSTIQDGLEVNLITDKEVYEESEQIEATLTVTNLNNTKVANVMLKHIVPKGYILADDSEAEKQVETLEAGKTIALKVTYASDTSEEGSGSIGGEETDGGGSTTNDSSGNTDTSEINGSDSSTEISSGSSVDENKSYSSVVQTGDNINVLIWCIMLVLSAVLIVNLVIRMKKGKKLLSLLICFTMTGTIASGSVLYANAAEDTESKEISIVESINIGEKSTELSAKVTYQTVVEEDDPEYSENINLYANQYKILVDNTDNEREIYFYAEYKGNASLLELRDVTTGEILTTLYDDGNLIEHGDEVSGDNVYTGIATFDTTQANTISINAGLDNMKSNTVTIDIVNEFTDKEFDAAEYISTELEELMSSEEYQAASKSEKIQKAISKLEELSEVGQDNKYVIKESIRYDGNTDILYYTDLLGTYRGIIMSEENAKGYYLAGHDSTNATVATNDSPKKTDRTYSSGLDYITSDMEKGVIIDGWALYVDNPQGRFDYYSELCGELENAGMEMNLVHGTVQTLKTVLNDQDFVAIACHGGLRTLNGIEVPIIEMPELTDKTLDKAYAADLNKQNVIKLAYDSKGNDFDPYAHECYYITPSFFETYYGNNGYGSDTLEDTIVYIGSCHGFGDDGNIIRNLANSFLYCGAECVIGHVNSVLVDYDISIMEDVIYELIDDSSVQAALYHAEEKFGETDTEYYERYTGKTINKVSAYNEIAYFEQGMFPYWSDYKNRYENTSIKGKITVENQSSIIPLSDVTVTVEKDGQFYKSTMTNTSGEYELKGFETGTYIIKYEKLNYEPITKEVTINLGENITQNVSMGSASEDSSDILEFDGHSYKFYDDSMSWEDAKAFCEEQGGHLVTITSEEEQNAVYQYVAQFGIDADIWIGISDVESEGDWSHWVTGEEVTYTNWGENEPDNIDGGQDYGVICTGYRSGSGYYVEPGQWDDIAANGETASGYFICEWDNNKSVFEAGDGSAENPYQVSNAEQLDAVRNDLTAHYIQVADIDMSGYDWSPIGTGTHVPVPIGSSVEDIPFEGEYNGNNYKITNLSIAENELETVGLFGLCSEDSKIENITIESLLISVSIEQYNKSVSVGGIAGRCESIISNCNVSGNIEVKNCYEARVGGIIGYGCVLDSSNYADILVQSNENSSNHVYCGGVTGFPLTIHGTVERCVNYGNIDASSGWFLFCGGISGEYGEIEKCVNYGNVSGSTTNGHPYSSFAGNCNVGGIVGATLSRTSNSVNYGNINGDAALRASCYVGGITGYNGYDGSGIPENCFNVGENITATKLIEQDGIIVSADGEAGRIAGRSPSTMNCYSIDSTLVNGAIPTTNIEEDNVNGESLSKEEIDSIINQLFSSN